MVIACTGADIFKRAIKGEDKWFKRMEAMRIATVMKMLGFVRSTYYDSETKSTKMGYIRPEYAGDGEDIQLEMKAELVRTEAHG